MRSFLLFSFLILIIAFGYCQNTINQTDDSGKKQGHWIKKDKDGKKVYEGQFTNDIPYDTFRYYYPGGELKAVSVLSDNGKRSWMTTYFKNGKLMAEGLYVNEKRDSTWKFYSEFDKVVVSEEVYKNGKKDGISKTFYPDGVVAERSTWKNGVRSGTWEQFYTDGKLKLKCAFLDDQKDGPLLTYHMSGRIWLTGQYIMGDADGTWTYMTDKGEIEKKEYFSKGRLLKTEEFMKKENK